MSSVGQFVLTLACRDSNGMVFAVTGERLRAGCGSVGTRRSGDVQRSDATGRFAVRIDAEAGPRTVVFA